MPKLKVLKINNDTLSYFEQIEINDIKKQIISILKITMYYRIMI